MKKLGKFEVAILKRNALSLKPIIKKVAKLQKEIDEKFEEMGEFKNQIEKYHDIERDMTGGLTGEEYLAALSNPEAFEKMLKDSEEESLNKSEKFEEDSNQDENMSLAVPENDDFSGEEF